MAILDDVIKEKKKVFKFVRAKIDEDCESKIKFICDKAGVKEEDYLGKLLEFSEIDKVYKELQNKSKVSDKLDENSN